MQLEFEDLSKIVSGNKTRPATAGDEQNKFDKANQKSKLIILFSVSDEVQPHIHTATSAKDA